MSVADPDRYNPYLTHLYAYEDPLPSASTSKTPPTDPYSGSYLTPTAYGTPSSAHSSLIRLPLMGECTTLASIISVHAPGLVMPSVGTITPPTAPQPSGKQKQPKPPKKGKRLPHPPAQKAPKLLNRDQKRKVVKEEKRRLWAELREKERERLAMAGGGRVWKEVGGVWVIVGKE